MFPTGAGDLGWLLRVVVEWCPWLLCALQGKKPKLGLKESFRVLGKSKYLGFLATLVLGYGLCIAMTEGTAVYCCTCMYVCMCEYTTVRLYLKIQSWKITKNV